MKGIEIQLVSKFSLSYNGRFQSNTFFWLEEQIIQKAFDELELQMKNLPAIKSWKDVTDKNQSPGLKKMLNQAVSLAIDPVLSSLQSCIPEMWDKIGTYNFKFKTFTIEVTEYERQNIEKTRLSIYFHTPECYMHQHFGHELLISLTQQGSTIGRSGHKQLDTFIVILHDNISISKLQAD